MSLWKVKIDGKWYAFPQPGDYERWANGTATGHVMVPGRPELPAPSVIPASDRVQVSAVNGQLPPDVEGWLSVS